MGEPACRSYRLSVLADCPEDGARPCGVTSCRYHLEGIEYEDEPGEEPVPVYTCALDFAADHPDGGTLEEVGDQLGVTRERVRQIEARALPRLVAGLRSIGAEPSRQWKEALARAKVEVTKTGELQPSRQAERVAEVRDLLALPLVRRRLARGRAA